MTWVSTGVAVGGAVLGAMNSDSGGSQTNGGAGTTTGTKEPWLQAQPWIKANLASGQSMQDRYTQTPFNAQQLNAYQALGSQTGYMNQLVPSLLGQISSQPLGFNRDSPTARPTPYTFNGVDPQTGTPNPVYGNAGKVDHNPSAQASQGLLAQLTNPPPAATSAVNPPPPPPPPAAAPASAFSQTSNNALGDRYPGMSAALESLNLGGYGSYKYGTTPAAGSQAETDAKMYTLLGGSDPMHLFTPNYGLNGSGNSNGDGGGA